MKRHQLLKALREALGLNCTQVAKATNLHVDTVRDMEKPTYNPTEGTTIKLYSFYGKRHKQQAATLERLKVELDRVGVGNGSAR